MKVGLITHCKGLSFAHYTFVASVMATADMSVSLIEVELTNTPSYAVNSKKHKSLIDRFNLRLLKGQAFLERTILKKFMGYKDWYKVWAPQDIVGLKVIKAFGTVTTSGITLALDDVGRASLRQGKFDVLISLDGPMSITELPELAHLGLLSTNCDHTLQHSVSLSSFWSVYRKKPTTGFHVNFRSSLTQQQKVVFKGNRTTKNLCWKYNYHYLQKECYHYLYQLMVKLNAGFQPKALSSSNNTELDTKLPKWYQILAYQWQVLGTLSKKTKNHLTRTGDYWTVYYSKGGYDKLDFSKVKKIENPKGGFFADPFILHYNNRNIVFVEEYVINEKKAIISALEIDKDDNYKYLGEVIREPFHLSYPFIFEYEDALYMIPESSAAKSIRLYKCKTFPLEWEYQHDLISNIDAVDTTIMFRDGKYWLFTNLKEQDWEHNSILECYVADSPISQQWRPHENNPVYFDNGARNGGFLYNGNMEHMVSQTYDIDTYGKSIQIKRIKILSENQFDAEIVKEFQPKLMKGIQGLHHMSSDDRFTVFDALQKRSINTK